MFLSSCQCGFLVVSRCLSVRVCVARNVLWCKRLCPGIFPASLVSVVLVCVRARVCVREGSFLSLVQTHTQDLARLEEQLATEQAKLEKDAEEGAKLREKYAGDLAREHYDEMEISMDVNEMHNILYPAPAPAE